MRPGTLSAQILHRLLDAIPGGSGAVVMGTEIVSVALLIDGRHVLSAVLLATGGLIWLALVGLLFTRALVDRERFQAGNRHPTALVSIAGTAVLGARLALAGWNWVGTVLLIVATASWLVLVPQVLHHWQTPTSGASFILTVATESLAVLAATLAFSDRTAWLAYAALAPFGMGLGLYVFVLGRFQFRQLAVGIGDHWVTGGALAISTVAAWRIALAAQRYGILGRGDGPLKTVALVLWCVTMVWLPVLIGGELLRPRLSYNVRRWATVFPVGMYAACSFGVGELTQVDGIIDFARIWVWVAVVVWLIVFAGMVARAPRLARSSWGNEVRRG